MTKKSSSSRLTFMNLAMNTIVFGYPSGLRWRSRICRLCLLGEHVWLPPRMRGWNRGFMLIVFIQSKRRCHKCLVILCEGMLLSCISEPTQWPRKQFQRRSLISPQAKACRWIQSTLWYFYHPTFYSDRSNHNDRHIFLVPGELSGIGGMQNQTTTDS